MWCKLGIFHSNLQCIALLWREDGPKKGHFARLGCWTRQGRVAPEVVRTINNHRWGQQDRKKGTHWAWVSWEQTEEQVRDCEQVIEAGGNCDQVGVAISDRKCKTSYNKKCKEMSWSLCSSSLGKHPHSKTDEFSENHVADLFWNSWPKYPL